jgi:hypothetical protein
MTHRSALLIGIESPLSPAASAAADALAASLARLGFLVVHRTSSSATYAEVVAARDAWLAEVGADDVGFVWVYGPTVTGQLVLADGTLDLGMLTAGAPSVRSILRVFDVSAPGLSGSDPTLVAAAGAPIGQAVVDALLQVPTTATFADLCRAVQAAVPVTLTPSSAQDSLLAGLLDGGPSHVPWRGVDAWYEFQDDWELPFVNVGGGLGFTPTQEQWSFAGQPFPPVPLQGIWQNQLGPRAPTQFNFTNQGFAGPAPVRPDIQAGDVAYQMVSQGLDITFVIIRNVANPTAAEWYTNQANTQYLVPNPVPGTLAPIDQATLNNLWNQANAWFLANEARI